MTKEIVQQNKYTSLIFSLLFFADNTYGGHFGLCRFVLRPQKIFL